MPHKFNYSQKSPLFKTKSIKTHIYFIINVYSTVFMYLYITRYIFYFTWSKIYTPWKVCMALARAPAPAPCIAVWLYRFLVVAFEIPFDFQTIVVGGHIYIIGEQENLWQFSQLYFNISIYTLLM